MGRWVWLCAGLAALVLSVALGASARGQQQRPESTTSISQWASEQTRRPTVESTWVRILSGGVVSEKKSPTLHVRVMNKKDRTIWVRVRFRRPKEEGPCEAVAALQAGQSRRFVCPVPAVVAGKNYPVTVKVYSKEGQKRVVDRLDFTYRFTEEELQALERRYEIASDD